MKKNCQANCEKSIERHFKGIANHYRIAILILVGSQPGISVEDIANQLRGNFKTISEHTRRLVQAGLVNKQYQGHHVTHTLSPYGQIVLRFVKSFQNL